MDRRDGERDEEEEYRAYPSMMIRSLPSGDVLRPFRFDHLNLALVFCSFLLWPTGPALAQGPGDGDRDQFDGQVLRVGDDEEIVVTARYGDALVEPETELDEQQIGAYGAYSIGDLVRGISPLTGRPGELPIILINGERVESVQDLYGYPPAALQRLAVLPAEAAGRYGYSGDRRVVNLVLKKHFVSWEGQAGLKLPTAGGRRGGNVSAGRFVIDGRSRWNAQVQLSGESALRKSSRTSMPSADTPEGADPDEFISLLPETRQILLTLGLVRPIGPLTGSFSVSAGANSSRRGLGRGDGDPVVSSGAPLLDRQNSKNLSLAMALSGPVAGWRANFNVNYARDWFHGRIDQSDHAIADGFRTNHNRSRGENLGVRLIFSNGIASLPAGPLTANISVGMNRNRSRSRYDDGLADDEAWIWSGRDRYDGRLSLGVPIFSRKQGGFSALGDLSLDFAASLARGPREPSQSRIDLGANWTPIPALRINAAVGFAKLAPSIEQLNAPYREEVRRVYDFVRQEVAEPVWVSGGNPDLGSGRRRTYSLGATLRPFDPRLLTISTEYRKKLSTGGAGGFPGLTLAVEDAFPERFVRDESGRLVRVDARPIRIVRDLSERLDSGVTLSLAPGAKRAAENGNPLAAVNIWNLSFTLNHGWNLRSELLTRAGIPPIDRLRGGTAQSRHTVGFQFVAGRPGAGLTLDANWQSGFRLRDLDRSGSGRDYRHKALTTVNLRLFAEPQHLLRMAETPAWLSNLTVSLDARNLLDAYRRVTLPDGSVPAGYRRYEVDPLGRTVQMSVRKRF